MDSSLNWFETLYDTYADQIWRHLYFRLGDRERAQELMQEVFMRVWNYIQEGKTITHEKAFLYTAARNLFINEIRAKKDVVSLDDNLDESVFVEQHIPSPQKEAEARELMEHLNQLKEPYREVLIMRYIDGLQVRDIAEFLGEQETAISMRIKRGIDALQKRYRTPTMHSGENPTDI